MAKNDHNDLTLWEERILEWKRSGLTRKEFCKKNEVKITTFAYRRRKINAAKKNGFIEVRVPAARGRNTLSLHLKGGMVIDVPQGFDPALLRNILTVVEHPPCS